MQTSSQPARAAANPDALLTRALGVRQFASNIFNYTVGSGIFLLPATAVLNSARQRRSLTSLAPSSSAWWCCVLRKPAVAFMRPAVRTRTSKRRWVPCSASLPDA